MSGKQYRASLDDSEKKLSRVMERLGVEKYQSTRPETPLGVADSRKSE